ncbi:MAG: phosphoesterase [Nitrospirota bacterium]|nr:phosphoesterase [Nitrospirota bacterium]
MSNAAANTQSSFPDQLPLFEPEIVLYHADCPDGFGAAWAMWRRFPGAEFHPVRHGMPPPTGLAQRRVVIVDFSYDRATIERMAREAARMAVLDHHVTAQQALGDLPYVFFDQTKSGAVLSWEWAHRAPAPWLLQYVQDKDLRRWQLSDSREINAAIESHPFDFALWEQFRQETLALEGRAILRAQGQLLVKVLASAVLVRFEGATVPAVHSAIFRSELGERLSVGVPFCLVWYERAGRRYVSLRSSKSGADVAVIAARHGGGGHCRAAGFSLPVAPEHPLPFDVLSPYSAVGPTDE